MTVQRTGASRLARRQIERRRRLAPVADLYVMRSLWKIVDLFGFALRDCVLVLIGHRRIKLGEWPDQGVVEAAVNTVHDLGGKRIQKEDLGLAFDIENAYFCVQGRRVRLCIEEYGEVSLWGAKGVVTELSKRIAERLSAKGHENGTA